MESIFLISWILMFIYAIIFTFVPIKDKDGIGLFSIWFITIMLGWIFGIITTIILIGYLLKPYVFRK